MVEERTCPFSAAAVLARLAAAGPLLVASPALAAYTAAVDADEARQLVSVAAGVLFTASFLWLLARVLGRRAARATSVRLVSPRRAAAAPPESPVTAVACFQGAALAVLCTAALWWLAGVVEGLFDAAPPSEQYAVRNVTGTLRSITTGLVYLATGLFAANAVGLSGLGLQTLLQAQTPQPPPAVGDAPALPPRGAAGAQLPPAEGRDSGGP